jgi:hypothetical protein
MLVYAQESSYPTIVVDYREIRIVPDDFTSLYSSAPPFSNEPALAEILSFNNTWFWEPLGPINADFSQNFSLSTYAIVVINETGFYETLVGLSANNQSLKWVAPLNSSMLTNFSKVIHTATDFFAKDSIYWGLCEEIVVIPGFLAGFDFDVLWRLDFHLVAESERWSILIDMSGNIIDSSFITIPCAICPYTPLVIVAVSIAITLCFTVVIYLRKIRKTT